MNILIFSWRGPGHPNAGGAEVSTHEHTKGWVKAGHSVTLFTSYYQGAKRKEVIDGVTLIRRGRQFFGVQWEAFKWYLFGQHPEFDLVIDQFHGVPFFTPFYVRTKKMGFIHEVTKEVWRLNPLPRPFNLIPAFLGPILEPLMFMFYKNIQFMTVSESTKNELVEWGIRQTNITIVHNGVTIHKLKEAPSKERKKTIVYLGAISKDKGIEDALKAFSSINNTEDGWQFWVVGKSDPRYLKKLKSLSENLGISSRVKFWGFVGEEKKFELLTRSHLFINPSIREGWGLVNTEANSVGLPVLAYDVSGSRDSVRQDETGFLSSPGNYNELAANAVKLMNDKNLYQRMQNQARIWSKNFSWDKSSRQSLNLLKKLTKKEYQ